jgi:hypothetical protein
MKVLALFTLLLLLIQAKAQVYLSGTSYFQDFNGLSAGLPAGWSLRTGATRNNLGNDASGNFLATPSPDIIGSNSTYWKNITAKFKNFASFNNALVGKYAEQAVAADRALGIRQSSALGDPGAAFVFHINDTQGFRNFQLSFQLQSLDDTNGERRTTWSVDYGIGTNPNNFVELGTGYVTGANQLSNNTISISLPANIDNLNQSLWIRIVTLSPSTNPMGAANPTRTSSAIDNFSLSYQQMPTPISLQYFKALLNDFDKTVNLKWVTISERNNQYFILERSNDLVEYEPLGVVDGAINSQTLKEYTFIDAFPKNGINYYRLSQVDSNGGKEVFRPVAVRIVTEGGNDVAKVYPTIIESKTNVIWIKDPNIAKITLVNIYGIQQHLTLIQQEDSFSKVILNNDLPTGLYILRASTWDGIDITEKIYKK